MTTMTARLLISIIILASLCAEAPAQRKSASKKKTTPKQTTDTRIRPRRVASSSTSEATAKEKLPAKSPEAGNPPTVDFAITSPKPSESTKPDQATVGPADQPGEKKPEVKVDPPAAAATPSPGIAADDSIESLRDRIDAATTEPERIKLQLKLADQLVTSGNKTEALAELNRVAVSEAFDPPGFYNLGNSFARLGETDAAVSAYRKAIEQRKGRYSRAYNNLGVVHLRVGRWDDAYEAFLSALKLESFRYAEASYNMGRLYAARGQHDLAVREWRRALAVDPEHKAAAQAITGTRSEERITVATASPVKANPLRDKIREPRATSTSAPVETGTKSAPAASLRSPKVLTLDQVSFDYLQKARTAAERGSLVDAVDNFRRVIARQGGYFAPANLELSYALLTLKKYDEALPNLVQVSRREGSRYPISYFHLGRLYELRGELQLAENSFSQAVAAHDSANNQFLLDLSRVREKQSNYKGALEALEKYISTMDQQGLKPSWSEERLAILRGKVTPK